MESIFSDPSYLSKSASDIDPIIEGQLYMSDVFTAENLKAIEPLGITHIVTVSGGIYPRYLDKFAYKVIKIDDSPF